MPYKVTVERNTLRFAAAHFATGGGTCERLHGHNYDVSVEVQGELASDGWVIDFAVLKSLTRELCQQLDHRFILQRDSISLEIEETERNWKVRFADRGWVFPTSDVVALPIENTTAEQLARWFANRLRAALGERASNLTSITVGVEEMPGQAGWWTEAFA
jgi:6-pyruvoyltetrahydropterin/6-carboxytetrahydropterin synthase